MHHLKNQRQDLMADFNLPSRVLLPLSHIIKLKRAFQPGRSGARK